jgi:hypothetical protein
MVMPAAREKKIIFSLPVAITIPLSERKRGALATITVFLRVFESSRWMLVFSVRCR